MADQEKNQRTLDTTAEVILDAWDLSPAVKAAQNKGVKRRRFGLLMIQSCGVEGRKSLHSASRRKDELVRW